MRNVPQVDVTDRNGSLLGYRVPLNVAYRQGLWHRAVQVVVYTPKGEVLVQQRALDSYVYPGALDISAAGGVDPGETPLHAAARELREELGIRAHLGSFEPLPVLHYSHIWRGGHPRSIIYPFLVELEGEAAIKLQVEEVASAKFVDWQDANQLVKRQFLPGWSRLIRRHGFYRYLLSEVAERLSG